MSELVKSIVFLSVAALASLVAFLTRPEPFRSPIKNKGDKVFPKFTSEMGIEGLEIVQYDKSSGKIRRLKIIRQAGGWQLDSHQRYPASANDVEDRIQRVAASLTAMEVLDTKTQIPSEHPDLGVLDPDQEDAEQKTDGLGMRIAILGEKESRLAELIVGDPIKGYNGLRFVCRPGHNDVYVAKFDAENIVASVGSWVNDDALDTAASELKQVDFKSYAIEELPGKTPTGEVVQIRRFVQQFDMTLQWNDKDFKWTLAEFMRYARGQKLPVKLTEAEQLHTENLDELRNTIKRLKIIDLEDQPPLPSPGAKEDEIGLALAKRIQSRQEHGFYRPEEGEGIMAAEGEIQFSNQEGILYTLMIGKGADVVEIDGNSTVPRYLLVTAALDQEGLRPPTRESVLEQIKQEEAAENNDPATGQKPGEKKEKKDPEKEFQRQLNEFREKLDAAEKKVTKLNQQFDRQYFIISEETYGKLHLGLFDLIQQDRDSGKSYGVDAFRQLEAEGLKKQEANPTPMQ